MKRGDAGWRAVAGAIAWVLLAAGCRTAVAPAPQMEQQPEVVSLLEKEARPPSGAVRICTYNVQNFSDGVGDGSQRTATVVERQARGAAALLNRVGADVVVLQEIENPAALERLNALLTPPYPVAIVSRFEQIDPSGRKRVDNLNIALLSRLPVRRVRELDFYTLQGPTRPPRGTLCAEIDLDEGHRLLLYGVHLKSNYGDREINRAKRKGGLELILADAERVMASDPGVKWEVAVAGDMNTDPDQASFADDPTLAPLAEWVDLWRSVPAGQRITIPTRRGDPAMEFPPAAFDRVVVSPAMRQRPWVAGDPVALPAGVETNNVYVLPGQSDAHVSDHYPVYVDLEK